MRLVARFLMVAGIGIALAIAFVTDNALHVTERAMPRLEAATAIADRNNSTWERAQVPGLDGVPLDGWLFTPREPNGSLVLLLHGVGDTRLGMLGHALFLLRGGFSVLAVDSRGHGSSGGSLITFGVREAGDVRRWTDWALRKPGIQRLYGLGESMGAAILLESLVREPRFRAVVAECSFATFEEVSYDRLKKISRLPRPLLWPVVKWGFLYVRVRYGVDLMQASPVEALRRTTVPVLLIHGMLDANIPFRHSQELHSVNPNATRLWLVEGAEHAGALSRDPENYSRTVTDWFDRHR